MAVSFCYSVDDVIAAISNADSYRNKAVDTGHYNYIDAVLDAEIALDKADLSAYQQEVIYYRWRLGCSHVETAEIMGKTTNAVDMAVVRVKQKLQTVLDQWEAEENV